MTLPTDCKGRKVLFVVPLARFKDEEYSKPRGILERKGATIVVAAQQSERPVFGFNQTRVKPDMTLDQVNVADYDAVYFVGGMGVKDLYENQQAHRIIQEAVAHNKILAAVDMAPTLLAKAGVLAGKKATEYFSESKLLQSLGVQYTASTLQQDGNIYTGKGPEAAEPIGMALVKALQALPAG